MLLHCSVPLCVWVAPYVTAVSLLVGMFMVIADITPSYAMYASCDGFACIDILDGSNRALSTKLDAT